MLYLNGLRANGTYLAWSEKKFNFFDDPSSNLQGNLKFTDFKISGFNSLSYTSNGVQASSLEDESFTVCLNNLLVDNVQFGVKYEADMGVNDEIPFYGNGELLFNMDNLDFSMCLNLTADKTSVDNVALKFTYRHQPVSVSGLYTSDEFSATASEVFTLSNRMLAMWNLYEPDCTSCILSPFMQYFINSQIGEKNPGEFPKVKCSCLEDIQYSIYGELMKYLEDDEIRSLIFLLLEKFVEAISPTESTTSLKDP